MGKNHEIFGETKQTSEKLAVSPTEVGIACLQIAENVQKRAYVNVWATNTAAPNQWILFVKKIEFYRRAKKRNQLYFGHICRFLLPSALSGGS